MFYLLADFNIEIAQDDIERCGINNKRVSFFEVRVRNKSRDTGNIKKDIVLKYLSDLMSSLRLRKIVKENRET